MNLLNSMSRHPHTCAICESSILHSALKSHLVFKAYLFLKHEAHACFSFFNIHVTLSSSLGEFQGVGSFLNRSKLGGENVNVILLCVQSIDSFLP